MEVLRMEMPANFCCSPMVDEVWLWPEADIATISSNVRLGAKCRHWSVPGTSVITVRTLADRVPRSQKALSGTKQRHTRDERFPTPGLSLRRYQTRAELYAHQD